MPEVIANLTACYAFRRARPEVEFLLLRRAAHLSFGDTWQPVYGRIEAAETAWQAALRELREETGLRPLRMWQTADQVTFYVARTDQLTLCTCFAAEIDTGTTVRLSSEHLAFAWRPVTIALEQLIWPAQRRILRQIMDELVTPGRAEPHLRIPLPPD